MYLLASMCTWGDLLPRRSQADHRSTTYRWEYVTNLDFEWEIYTGRRHWRWSFVVYLVARALALACLVTMLIGFDVTTRYDCDVRIHPDLPLFLYVFPPRYGLE